MTYSIGGYPGLLRVGVIQSYSEDNISVDVALNSNLGTSKQVVTTQLPLALYANSGGFIGGYPEPGTIVAVSQAEGGSWYIVSVLAKDPNSKSSVKLNKIPSLSQGGITIQSNNSTKIILDKSDGILIGNIKDNIKIDTIRSISSSSLKTKISLTEASRNYDGIIKRDVKPNSNFSSLFKELSPLFDDSLKSISLDPTLSPSLSNFMGSSRNPPFVEKREVVFEFANSYKVSNDEVELSSYKTDNEDKSDQKSIINRRESRADALSLSLVSPNHLMETIKGTVVDIYGNILDINRAIIPIGKSDNLSLKNIKNTYDLEIGNSFREIKKIQRKSIAFHFELNARKDLSGLPDVESKSDYARQRSRFFVDIDKEGLFKLNVPASSETGNIPLLTRYENYSTVSPNKDTNDPNDLAFNDNKEDILIESFAYNNGVIKVSDELSSNGLASPKERFDNTKHIGHGTAYHDIVTIGDGFLNNPIEYIETTRISEKTTSFKNLTLGNLVSPNITISGPKANAGGRSGSLSFDGSLEVNIGANTIDRQSIWLDTAGGVIGKLGRDKNNVSIGMSLDGDMLIQVGGPTVSSDSRFLSLNNAHRAGTVDIRVFNNNKGEYTTFRIDADGISVSTPGRIVAYANQDVLLRSSGTIDIEAETLLLNRRPVKKIGGSI